MTIRFSRYSIIFATLILVAQTDLVCADTPEVEIQTLMDELSRLEKSLGKDHVKVVTIRKKIGLLKSLAATELPEHQAIIKKLTPMLVEEQQLQAKFGRQHPQVLSIRRKIEFTTKYLTDQLNRPADSKAGDPHAAFRKLLPLLLKEQELIVKHGAGHSSVAAVQQKIGKARMALTATSPTNAIPGRSLPPSADANSPSISNDPDKSIRYRLEEKNGTVVLRDQGTGVSWILKTNGNQRQWVPVRGPEPDVGQNQ